MKRVKIIKTIYTLWTAAAKDREARSAAVHGVAKSWTQLND